MLSRLRSKSVFFPLLRKELVEQSARKRLYILRVVAASALFIAFGSIAYSMMGRLRYGFTMVGMGSQIFQAIVGCEFVGVYVLLPAMMCGVLTSEKERESMSLLLLTDLRPWEILVDKFLGRMLPMVYFLMLGVPLMALCYSLGGVTAADIAWAVFFLGVAALQAGTLSLMVSAFCRTTTSAFIASYLLLAAFLFVLPIIDESGICRMDDTVSFCLWPAYLFFEGRRRHSPGWLLAASIPTVLPTLVFILLSRAFLVRRALSAPRNILLSILRRLDAFYTRLNDWGMGGVILIKDRGSLPDDHPVAWRETTRKSLGRFSYLLRILLVIEFLVFVIASLGMFPSQYQYYSSESEFFAVAVFVMWGLAVLAITAQGVSVIGSERNHQTLDVLSTTPLEGRQIVREKMRGVHRFIFVWLLPLITFLVFEAMQERTGYAGGGSYHSGLNPLHAAILSAVFACLYLPMFAWLALWIGLKVRSRAKALATCLAVVLVWNGLPPLLAALAVELDLGSRDDTLIGILFMASPAVNIVLTEVNEWRGLFDADYIGWICVSLVVYLGILLFIRQMCLCRADKYLGRVQRSHVSGEALTVSVTDDAADRSSL
jgi:ABC-type transport system involved in multi-copper enzyme maturation permease subunit